MSKKRKLEITKKRNYQNEKNSKVDEYGRRVWDTEYFEKKIKEKPQEEEEEDELILKLMPDLKKKKKILPAVEETKLLEGRTEELSLEKNLGKTQILTLKATKEEQGGYYCQICDCVLKDSQTYLDHINGKNHNRMLGFSMKVKKVTVDEVKNKLELLKKKKINKLDAIAKDPYEEAKQNAKELERLEELKRQRRKQKRRLKKLEESKNVKDDKEESVNEQDEKDEKDEKPEVQKGENNRETLKEHMKNKDCETTVNDVEEADLVEEDINVEMKKMGLPIAFV